METSYLAHAMEMSETSTELDARDEQRCYAHQFVIPTNNDVGADSVPGDRCK